MIHLDPADVFDALRLAIDSRHAELALTLFSRAETVVLSDSGRMLLLAEKTVLLAETLRMPKQHFSVWSTHLSLLEEAVRLLTAIRPNSDASLDQVKVALLKRARHLLGEQGHAPLGLVRLISVGCDRILSGFVFFSWLSFGFRRQTTIFSPELVSPGLGSVRCFYWICRWLRE